MISQQIPNNKFQLSFRLIYSEISAIPVLVFEDLTALGYTMHSKQMDLEMTKVLLSRLAKLHASTLDIERRSPGSLSTNFREGCFQLRNDIVHHIKDCFCLFADSLEQWPEENSQLFAGKIRTILDSFEQEFANLFSQEKNKVNVLNHGDFHNRNIMYQDDTRDFVVFDYQLCYWGSPVVDIIFALYLIMRPGFEDHHQDLISIYGSEFKRAVQQLNITGIECENTDLEQDMRSHRFLGKYRIIHNASIP